MTVKLLNYTPLEVADIAICKCYSNTPHTEESKRIKRIKTVANVSKHSSVVEHISYSLDIDGISRACLQELARHRIASYTVKSSRYTLQELKNEESFIYFIKESQCFDLDRAYNYIVATGDINVDYSSIVGLEQLRIRIMQGVTNDKAKYCMPEAYKTSLVMTINARSLQNFFQLRTDKKALWEIQLLAKAMFDCLPKEHKQLFEEFIK